MFHSVSAVRKEGESFDEPHHEDVRIGMRLQMVDVGLLDIPKVSDAQPGAPHGEVQREAVAPGRTVVQGGKLHHTPGIALGEYLVVGLSVVGREHRSQEGHIQLVAQAERHTSDTEVPYSPDRRIHRHGSAGIGGIVAVAEVPEEAAAQVGQPSGEQVQAVGHGQVIVQPPIPVDQGAQRIVVVHVVVRIIRIALEKGLAHPPPVRPAGATQALAREAELDVRRRLSRERRNSMPRYSCGER